MVKRAPRRAAAILSVIALAVLTQCKHPSPHGIEYLPVSRSNTYSGPIGDEVFYVESSGAVDLTYTLNNVSGKNVYFVLTNTAPYKTASNPVVNSAAASAAGVLPRARGQARGAGGLVRTPAHVQRFNAGPPLSRSSSRGSLVAPPLRREVFVEGTTSRTFFDDLGAAVAGAVVRKIVTGTDATLVVWVEPGSWVDTAPADHAMVTQAMVDALAAKFLAASGTDDIHHWVSNVYGLPWGDHAYPAQLIAKTTPQEIHILLYDIDGDQGPVAGQGYTAGFFYGRDNFVKTTGTNTPTDSSNALLMFYLDAPLLANNSNGGTWDLSGPDADYWPAAIVSTLAHEFQHMINFYQKDVLRGGSSETWLDEMASLVTEDFVADKVGVNGPRGVSYLTMGPGAPANTQGRLPYFLYFDDVGLTAWGGVDTLASYSIAYAFGAYLARNYGGAALFQSIVQRTAGDYTAIEAATGVSFGDLLRRWGAAVLLSDTASAAATQQYNIGGAFDSAVGSPSVTYNLGSINMYNYTIDYVDGQGTAQTLVGPYLYQGTGAAGYSAGHLPASNLYYAAATPSPVASRTWHVRMDAGVQLTVVVKEP